MGWRSLLGMKSATEPQVRAVELNRAEQEFLAGHRARFRQMVSACGARGDIVHDAPRLAGEVLEWWRASPSERGDANDVVFALGAGLGDHLAPRLGMRWMVVTDAFGTSLSLYTPAKGHYQELVLSPIDSVAKRFEAGTASDLTDYVEAVVQQIGAMKGA